jgi:hypothetical protein
VWMKWMKGMIKFGGISNFDPYWHCESVWSVGFHWKLPAEVAPRRQTSH